MKIYLVFFAFIFFGAHSKAQGNLQFNQVKMIVNTDPPQTVPIGKVWKIESVFSYGTMDTYPTGNSASNQSFFSNCGVPSGSYYPEGRYMAINAIPLSFGIQGVGYPTNQLPIWLPAGSTICTCSNSNYCARGYSLIEFNIVP